MVKKCIKNSKSFNHFSTAFLNKDNNFKANATIGCSVLESASTIFCFKTKSWSMVSKFTQSSHVHSQTEEDRYACELFELNINKLRKDGHIICAKCQEAVECIRNGHPRLEENLEDIFRSLVKTRVSLPNVFSSRPLVIIYFCKIIVNMDIVY